jgi:hypothetical protein
MPKERAFGGSERAASPPATSSGAPASGSGGAFFCAAELEFGIAVMRPSNTPVVSERTRDTRSATGVGCTRRRTGHT